MSSTSGVQNYLSNVFRPVYTYDTTTSLFTPKLEVSNVDNYSGNTISVFTVAVGDSNSNVYVGSNAGNPYNITKNCSNVTALGYGAASNISNDCNSVYIGWYAGSGGQNSRDVISIGANSGGNGSSNVFIGTNTGTVGLSNIFIGHHIDPGNVDNQIKIGYYGRIPIAADLCTNWVGLGGVTSPVHLGDGLDVSGSTYILGNVGINTMPGIDGTLDVNGNFNVDDGYGYLRFRTVPIDTPSNTEVTLSNYDVNGTALLNVVGSTQSTDGFWSSRGSDLEVSNTSNVSIGTLKKGLAMISVSASTTQFDGRTSFVLDTTSPVVSNLASNKSVGTTVNFTANAINISNTSGGDLTYSWSITYFPLI